MGSCCLSPHPLFFLVVLGFELMLARHVIYRLSHIPSSFCLIFFRKGSLLLLWMFLESDPLISTS
jgi:hypothetical protein